MLAEKRLKRCTIRGALSFSREEMPASLEFWCAVQYKIIVKKKKKKKIYIYIYIYIYIHREKEKQF